VRTVAGVIIGYVIFAVSAALLFQVSGRNPHGGVSMPFMLSSIVYGMFFAALGGWVAARIAKTPWKPAIAVAVVIATGALLSISMSSSRDARWSQWSAVLLMAPSALIGGWLVGRRSRSRESY
jgi:hypothetical protein